MLDIRQSIQYANYLSKIGWEVERVGEVNYFIKKFPIIGSVIKIQRPEEIKIAKIKELAKKHKAFQIIIEPKGELDANHLISLGFKLSKSPYLPSKTLQINLTKPKKDIFRHFKKDARYAIKKNNKLSTTETPKLEEFRNPWKKAVGWKRYVPPLTQLLILKKSFKKNCLFLMTEDKNSGAIFLLAEAVAYYWQAFTNEEGRKNLSQYKIVWEGVLWAKRQGARIFDFEGIYDERFPNKTWEGFTHFKKSFGGYEVTYPGTFVKWFP